MIIDTFVFFNEVELLEMRLNILNEYVDRFVLVEATNTFQGKTKPLFFTENRRRFERFERKITHVVVDDLPADATPFDREHYQRNAIIRGLEGCRNEDLIILSDLDEIPNPEVIPRALEKGRIGVFEQNLFYYALNTKCVNLDLLPYSMIVRFDELGSPAALRKRLVAYHAAILSGDRRTRDFEVIKDGGWQFSFLGNPESIVTKIEAFAHDELNNDEYKDVQHIRAAIASGRDLFGRKMIFAQASLDELPKVVVENLETYGRKGLLDFSLPDAVVVERDIAVADRGAALLERDAAFAERDAAFAERDAAFAERDAAFALLALMRESASWRLTRPLRFAARLVRHGVTKQDRQRLAQGLRNRYHRLPLPVPAKRLASFAYHRLVRKVFRLIQRVLPVTRFKAPTLGSGIQQQGKADYIVWGVIDWHFRHQRPQQLALALAATGRRVFYVSPALVDDERAGFEVEALNTTAQIFQLKLFAKGAPSIYSGAPGFETVEQLRKTIGEVLQWADCQQIVSLVDHPFWHDIASVVPNSRLVYDCMDHHEGFGNNSESLLQLETRLLSEAELTITTSTWLDEAVAPHARQSVLVRNAGDYAHFSQAPESIYRDPQGRRVIGYYGAIAEWFDLDLVEAVATQHPDCSVLLIGADTVNARSRLSKLHNVSFTGEVPYNTLPHYLHGFDVCLLPFKVIPLTLATNPVKAYEYLSAGKPVVAVDLPEMAQFEGLVYAASGKDAFLEAVRDVLGQPESAVLAKRRKSFAEGQTWQHRAEVLIQHAESAVRDPLVSVVVVTYNNLDLTRACLSSLDEHSQYECLEIIVVDNASSDGSPAFLSEWVAGGSNRKLILNEDNRGFAAANNQGLAIATGSYLAMLNNDTYVTPGWIRTLVRHLERDKTIGLIGPVTNNIGNEAKIDIAYDDMGEMLLKSTAHTRQHIGGIYPLRTAAFFCVMMPRTTYERVGTLDEAFGRGFFEDDDYCRRIEQLGLRVVCAEDVFIHHNLSASFNKLKQQDRQKLFEENKKIYEAKWGEWVPHRYRG